MAQGCKIPYIDNVNQGTINVPATEVTRLRALHIQAAREITQAKFNNTTEELFTFKGGYMIMNAQGHAKYPEQIAFLHDLNSRLNPNYVAGPDLMNMDGLPAYFVNGIINVDKNINPQMNIVALNVFNTLSDVDKLNYFGNATVNIGDADYKTLLALDQNEVDSMLRLSTDWSITTKPEHIEFFKRQAEKFNQALSIYLGSINKSSVGLPSPAIRLNKLYEIQDMLKNVDDNTAAGAVHRYVLNNLKNIGEVIPLLSIEYSQQADNIYHLLNDLDQPNLSQDYRIETTRKIAKILNDSVQYLHLFNNMKEFHLELRRLGFKQNEVNVIDTSNTAFQNAFQTAVAPHITDGDYRVVLEFFKSPSFSTTGLKDLVRDMIVENRPDIGYSELSTAVTSMSTVITNFSKVKDVDTLLTETMQQVNDLEADIKKLHEELIVKAVYPTIEAKQKNRPEHLKLTKEQFRSQIGVAEVDEGFMKAWLDAGVKSNDPLLANVANIVAEAYYEAHQRNLQDAYNLANYADNLDINKMSVEERDRYYEGMTHEVVEHLVDDNNNLVPVDQDWLNAGGPTIEVEVFGERRVFKGNKPKRGFMTQKNTAKFAATKKAFDEEKNRLVEEIYDNVVQIDPNNNLTFNWDYLKDAIRLNWNKPDGTPNMYWREIYARFWTGYQVHTQRKDFEKDPIRIKTALSNALYTQFEAENYEPLTQANLRQLYTANAVGDLNVRLTSIPNGFNRIGTGYALSPLATDPNNETYRQWLIQNISGMMHRYENQRIYVFMYKDREYRWVDITDANSLTPTTGDPLQYFSLNRQLKVLKNDKYDIEQGGWGLESQRKWAALHADARKSGYYRELFRQYTDGNNVVKNGALRHGILPQVEKIAQFDGLGTGKDYWKSFMAWIRRQKAWLRSRQWANNVAGTTGNNNQDKESYSRQYIDGEPVRDVPFQYTTHIEDANLETDLLRSVSAYKAASNNYEEASRVEPVMQVIRRMVAGDVVLGLSARKTLLRDTKGNVVLGAFETALRKNSPNLNKKLLQFIDDAVYGEGKIKDDTELGHKLANKMSKYVSITNLMWNVSAMFTNVTVGHVNNIVQASSGEFATRKDSLEAAAEYSKYMAKDLIKDLTQYNPAKKSKIGQLNAFFDAIQGEYSSEMVEGLAPKGSTEKAFNRLTMWTQGGAEHNIQTVLMITMMKGHKLPSGRSLWDSVIKNDNQFIQFTPEVTPEVIKEFRSKLHAVNKNLHGQYAKLDKSMVSRYWLGKMAMMYKKYIYSSFRNRFGATQYDWELGDETTGYIRTYYSGLIKDWRNQNMGIGQKIWNTFNKGFLKPHAGIIDSLTFRKLSQNVQGVDNYLYGGLSEKERIANLKYTTELAWFLMMGIAAAAFHAMTEDDDDEEMQTIVLKNIEATLTRAQGDLGMFLPFYNNFMPFPEYGLGKNSSGSLVSFDKAQQMAKNPLAQMRFIDNVVKLSGQVFEDVSSGSFEQYERKGVGYQKGDYKAWHYAEKVLPMVSGYHHVLQFLNPQERLQYDSMIRDNSKTTKKKDSE